MSNRSISALLVPGAVCLLAPMLQMLAAGPRIPEGTFFLVSQLGPFGALAELAASGGPDLRLDPANQVYAFARSPVYALMGWSLAWPAGFLLLGWLAHAGFHAVVYGLARHGVASHPGPGGEALRRALPLWITFAIYPLGLASGLAGHGLTLLPHDAFGDFSMRTPYWIAMGVAVLLWLRGRRHAALLVTAGSCWIHPSAGILAFGLATLASAATWAGARGAATAGAGRVRLVPWLAAAALGAAPTLVRMLGSADLPGAEVGFGDWYAGVVKDEADDFSFLFQLLYRSVPFVVVNAVILAVVGGAARMAPGARSDPSLRLAAAIPLLFLLGVALELALAVWMPTPAVALLIGLTPGYRLLSFAFFPLLVLGARLAAVAAAHLARALPALSRPAVVRGLSALVLGATALGLLGVGVARHRARPALEMAAWSLGAGRVAGLDAYLAASARAGRSFFWTPWLLEADTPPVTYPGERSLLRIRALDRSQPEARPDHGAMQAIREEDFLALVGAVRRELPPGSGLVIPPYMRHFRDALPRYRIFFQEHHDGNLMLGSRGLYAFFLARMQALLGRGYDELPSKTSRWSYTEMRRAYLAVGAAQARALSRRHPEYRYWVAERVHGLDLPVVVRAGDLLVHDVGAAERD